MSFLVNLFSGKDKSQPSLPPQQAPAPLSESPIKREAELSGIKDKLKRGISRGASTSGTDITRGKALVSESNLGKKSLLGS